MVLVGSCARCLKDNFNVTVLRWRGSQGIE